MYRILLGAADSDLHERRPQEPVMYEVAFLQDCRHGLRGKRRILFPDDGLVDLRVERHTRFVDQTESMFLQDVEQLLVNKENALVKIVPFFRMLERAVEVVDDG